MGWDPATLLALAAIFIAGFAIGSRRIGQALQVRSPDYTVLQPKERDRLQVFLPSGLHGRP